ncbi:hypothetical protein BDFG_02571 [Blastomyces dermatitidis ATCC 26199]|nr:hypothetical protein BDFG_02571 [Blastomyces dermatitidis ATCC 26199]
MTPRRYDQRDNQIFRAIQLSSSSSPSQFKHSQPKPNKPHGIKPQSTDQSPGEGLGLKIKTSFASGLHE